MMMLKQSNLLFKRHFSSSKCIVPLIDLHPFLHGNAKAKQDVVDQIGYACEKIGFFSIKNHDVSPNVIDNMLQSSRSFFDLTHDEKARAPGLTEEYPFGYSGLMQETLSSGKKKENNTMKITEKIGDMKESFSMGPYSPKSGLPPPMWPQNPKDMPISFLNYYKELEVLSTHMCRAFALALGLDEHWFDDKTDRHRCALRSINYPDIGLQENQLRASAHSDYGTMTILLQDSCGGLQVESKMGEWIDVEPVPNTFVINLGDLMARWTNDRWVSTMHRVVEKSNRKRRQSVAFFHNVNHDLVVSCIETCKDSNNPPKYPPITSFDHTMEKHMASLGKVYHKTGTNS